MLEDKSPLNIETVTPSNSEDVSQSKESEKVTTPDVQTSTKPDVNSTESNDNDTITRLNGRIDDLERRFGERDKAQETALKEIKPDTAPKSSHPWFRNPFVAG
jgi:hypothetical protein